MISSIKKISVIKFLLYTINFVIIRKNSGKTGLYPLFCLSSFHLLHIQKECSVSLYCFIHISFAADFIRCMHRKYSNTAVNHFHTIICHNICDGSAAAYIDFTKFCELVSNACTLRSLARYSAFASLDPLFPRLPVNLLNASPFVKKAALLFSNASANIGS